MYPAWEDGLLLLTLISQSRICRVFPFMRRLPFPGYYGGYYPQAYQYYPRYGYDMMNYASGKTTNTTLHEDDIHKASNITCGPVPLMATRSLTLRITKQLETSKHKWAVCWFSGDGMTS
ncbi:hypothetical protein YC2023_015792 [Brassica napus]